MRSIDLRLLTAAALAILLTACSTPAPKPALPPEQAHIVAPIVPVPSEAAPAGPSAALRKQFAAAVNAMQAGKDETAINLFTAIAEQNPQLASPHTDLGILFYRHERLKEAEAAFQAALQRDGKDYVAANYLGMIYRTEGRFAEARSLRSPLLRKKQYRVNRPDPGPPRSHELSTVVEWWPFQWPAVEDKTAQLSMEFF